MGSCAGSTIQILDFYCSISITLVQYLKKQEAEYHHSITIELKVDLRQQLHAR